MKRLILVGAGHAHLHVIERWIAHPVDGWQLIVVSPHTHAPYSGMVPGWLSGVYTFSDMSINVEHLVKLAQGQFIQDSLSQLTPNANSFVLASGRELHFDLLSLDAGSTLKPPPVTDHSIPVLKTRPLAAMEKHWPHVINDVAQSQNRGTGCVMAVGGGPAGVEVLLAVLRRLRQQNPQRRWKGRLVQRGSSILPGLTRQAQQMALSRLRRAGVSVHTGQGFSPAMLKDTDLLIWATGAAAHDWQRQSGLAVDKKGYIAVDHCLRSLSHPQIFAVGDCCAFPKALPKAGVYAVRMGPILDKNLRRRMQRKSLQPWQPQSRALAILNTSDGKAIANWRGLAVSGRWVWYWKRWLDERFIKRYRRLYRKG